MKRIASLIVIILLLSIFGCSSGGNGIELPTNPIDTGDSAKNGDYVSHNTWGLFQFIVDPVAKKLEVVPIRAGNIHLNALRFLEPPPLTNLTIESVKFNGNIIDVDIGLRHPFIGQVVYTGFDVCGILITNGTVTGFANPHIVMAGNPEDTYLMNPDGYSPWWNPVNFPPNSEKPIFGYIDGMLGIPDEIGNYNSTVCGYKYFADGLGPDDGLGSLNFENRGMFSAGQKNIRHYTIHLGDDGLRFNYAVDACWTFPEGSPPWYAPDSFPISANRPEAFYVNIIETENDLQLWDKLHRQIRGKDFQWTAPVLQTTPKSDNVVKSLY